MIRRVVNISKYWRVIVYYNVEYGSSYFIVREVMDTTSPVEKVMNALNKLTTHKVKAFTARVGNKTSLVCFARHKSMIDYINSIVHEAEHIKQDMLEYYNVSDEGEPPAYTVGYIASKLISVFVNSISHRII